VTGHSLYNSGIPLAYIRIIILEIIKLYVDQLKSFINKNNDYVWKLRKSLYGILMVRNLWNNTLQKYLKKIISFKKSKINLYMLIYKRKCEMIIIIVIIDNYNNNN
jgi:hypothetical protein